jgi:hypothetical protein
MGQNTLNNTKWTKKIGEKLVELLRDGRFKAHACAIVGIDVKTLYNWLEASEKGEHEDWPGFQGFHLRVGEASAEYCKKMEDKLDKYASEGKNPDWRGAAWLLEKKFPKQYGEAAMQVEISGGVHISLEQLVDGIDKAMEANVGDKNKS